ncbi:MAG: putative DNA binding domain-containing protein [Treponema sp.]|nr:putative DNA binding domain-containing protein [Treponema sp.]
MKQEELRRIIKQGETSTVQFKQKLENKDSIAAEMIAFANSKGGIILFGIEDKTGLITGLDYSQLQDTGNTLSNIANDLVKPQIFINTEVVELDGKCILIASIDEGIAKPYKDKNGTIWVKQGGDKRKLTDNNEQIRLFQQNGLLFADEMIIPGSSIDDIDTDKIKVYLEKIDDSENDLPPEQLYKNLNILNNGRLTLGGLMFFAKKPQKYRPAFCIKAVSFFGNDISGTDYRDSEDITGTIPEQFERGMSFLTRNLHHVQAGQNFNSTGILEVSKIALEELLQNALTHRDYSKNASINLLIFDDRIELTSPGSLPNSLTIENIKFGNAVVRNNLIVSFSSKIMKYRGLGSGIRRAIKEEPCLQLTDDKDGERFIVTIPRIRVE